MTVAQSGGCWSGRCGDGIGLSKQVIDSLPLIVVPDKTMIAIELPFSSSKTTVARLNRIGEIQETTRLEPSERRISWRPQEGDGIYLLQTTTGQDDPWYIFRVERPETG